MKAALAGNLRRGEGYREFQKTIDSEFDRAGLTRLAPHQIENIYETNVSMAYAGGQMQKMIESAEDFPFWKYSAVLDGKTRPKHAALHGKIFRTGDFTFWPPIDFRCRCTAIPLTARQAGRYPKTDMPTPGEKKELYNNLESKTFAGNKQQKFMEWTAKQYKEADQYTRRLIDQAFDAMKEEIHELEISQKLDDITREMATTDPSVFKAMKTTPDNILRQLTEGQGDKFLRSKAYKKYMPDHLYKNIIKYLEVTKKG